MKRRRTSRRLATDLLAVDVGNSKVEALLVCDGEERCRWRVDYDGTPSGWKRQFALAATAARREAHAAVPIVVASVAPSRAAAVEAILRRTWRRRPHRASWRDPWPFRLGIRTPQTLGVDRLANVAGLMALGLRDGIAVDAGTAVTIDILERGRFVGGLILPGSALMARALHHHTAQLPLVHVGAPVPLVGVDTVSALQAGVQHGLAQALRGLTATLAARRRSQTVLTGGAAEVFAPWLSKALHVPDLLFLGLRLLQARRSA